MTKEDPCRAICRERCASESGDMPCYQVWEEVLANGNTPWAPCDECLRDAGAEVPEPRDPNAAIGDFFA